MDKDCQADGAKPVPEAKQVPYIVAAPAPHPGLHPNISPFLAAAICSHKPICMPGKCHGDRCQADVAKAILEATQVPYIVAAPFSSRLAAQINSPPPLGDVHLGGCPPNMYAHARKASCESLCGAPCVQTPSLPGLSQKGMATVARHASSGIFKTRRHDQGHKAMEIFWAIPLASVLYDL